MLIKNNKASNKIVVSILATSSVIIGIFGLVLVKFFPKPQPLSIDIVSSLQYGPVEISGIVQKDSPSGKSGEYLLVTPFNNVLVLDISGLDTMLGQQVLVTGMMNPPNELSGGKNVIIPDIIKAIK